jgi:GAF domain-containing protein
MVEQTTTEPQLPPAHTAAARRLNRALALTTDTAAFAAETLGELAALLHAAPASVLLLDRDGDALVLFASADTDAPATSLELRQKPAVKAALAARHSTLVEQPSGAPLVDQLGALLANDLDMLLFIPLVRQAKTIGALLLGAPPGQSFAPEDIALAEMTGSMLSGATYINWLTDAMSRRDAQLSMVADIAAHVSSSLETREVYRLVVQKLNEYFQVEAGSLLLRDETTDELIFVMTLEAGEEKLFGMRIPPGAGIAGHVAQTKEVYWSNNVQTDPRHYKLAGEGSGFTSETILCAPMVVKDDTIGVIELINKRDGLFTESDAQRLEAAANIIGVAIENARLFEFVRQRRESLERLLDRMMTKGVSQATLVEELARELETQDNLLVVKFTNPYIVGQPVRKPEMCFGRELLFKRMLSVLHQNSLLLYGERRLGKTTVLLQLELRLHAADDPDYRFRPIYIDLQGLEEEAFFHHIMEEILARFGKRAKGLPLRYAPARSSYPGRDFQRDMRTVVEALCGPQPDGRVDRLVLLMDEADVMYHYDERVLQEFRRIFMNDYAAYLSVVFAAVDIQRQWKRYESPLYNLFQQIELTPLTRLDTEQLVRMPVRGRYNYDEKAIDMIYRISSGRPMKVQHLCLEAINYIREQGRTHVTAEDIERISEAIKGQDLWL